MQRKIDHIQFLTNELKENGYNNRYIVAVPERVFSDKNLCDSYVENNTKLIKHNVVCVEYDVVNPDYEELFGDKKMFAKLINNPSEYIDHFLKVITQHDKGEISYPLEIFYLEYDEKSKDIDMHCYLHGTTIECDSVTITFNYNEKISKWFFLENDDFLILDIVV